MKLSFVIANDKASYVSKEHRICLFSVAKEAALNKQQIKPCVPFYILFIYWILRPLIYLDIHSYKKKKKRVSHTARRPSSGPLLAYMKGEEEKRRKGLL